MDPYLYKSSFNRNERPYSDFYYNRRRSKERFCDGKWRQEREKYLFEEYGMSPSQCLYEKTKQMKHDMSELMGETSAFIEKHRQKGEHECKCHSEKVTSNSTSVLTPKISRVSLETKIQENKVEKESLRTKLADFQKEYEKFINKNDEKEMTICTQERKLQDTRYKITQLESLNSKLLSHLDTNNANMEDISSQVSNLQHYLVVKQDSADKHMSEKFEFEKMNRDLKNDVSTITTALKETENKNTELVAALARMDAEKKRSVKSLEHDVMFKEQQIYNLNLELKRVKNDKESLESTHRMKVSQLEAKEKRLIDLQGELYDIKMALKRRNIEFEAKHNDAERKTKQNAILEEELMNTKKKLMTKEKDANEMQTLLFKNINVIESYKKTNASNEQVVIEKDIEILHLKRKLESSKLSLDKTEEQLKTLQERNQISEISSNEKDTIDKLTEELENERVENQRRKVEHDQLLIKVGKEQEFLQAESFSKYREIENKCNSFENEIKELKNKNSVLSTKCERLVMENKKAQEQNEKISADFHQEISNNESTIKDLQNKLADKMFKHTKPSSNISLKIQLLEDENRRLKAESTQKGRAAEVLLRDIDTKSKEIETLHKKLHDQVCKFNLKSSDNELRIKQLQQEYDSLKEEKNGEVEVITKRHEERISYLQEENIKLNQGNQNEKESTNFSLREEINIKADEIEKLQSQLKSMQLNLKESSDLKTAFESQTKELKKELRAKKDAIQEKEAKMIQMEEDIKRLALSVETSSNSLQESVSVCENLEKAMERSHLVLKGKDKIISGSMQEITRLKEKLELLENSSMIFSMNETAMQELERRFAESEKMLELKESALSRKDEELQGLTKTLEKMKEWKTKYESKNKDIQVEISAKVTQIKELTMKITTQEDQIKEYLAKISQLEKYTGRLNNDISVSKQQFEQKEKLMIEACQQAEQERNAVKDSCELKLKESTAESNEVRLKIKNCKIEVQTLEAELENTKSELKKRIEEIREMEEARDTQTSQLVQQTMDYEDSLNELRKAKKQLESEKAILESELKNSDKGDKIDEINKIVKDTEAFKKQIFELHELIKRKDIDVKTTGEENLKLQRELSFNKSAMKEIEEELENLQKEKKMRKSLAMQKESIELTEVKLLSLSESFEHSKQLLNKKDIELKNFVRKMSEKDSQCALLEKSLTDSQIRASVLEKENKRLKRSHSDANPTFINQHKTRMKESPDRKNQNKRLPLSIFGSKSEVYGATAITPGMSLNNIKQQASKTMMAALGDDHNYIENLLTTNEDARVTVSERVITESANVTSATAKSSAQKSTIDNSTTPLREQGTVIKNSGNATTKFKDVTTKTSKKDTAKTEVTACAKNDSKTITASYGTKAKTKGSPAFESSGSEWESDYSDNDGDPNRVVSLVKRSKRSENKERPQSEENRSISVKDKEDYKACSKSDIKNNRNGQTSGLIKGSNSGERSIVNKTDIITSNDNVKEDSNLEAEHLCAREKSSRFTSYASYEDDFELSDDVHTSEEEESDEEIEEEIEIDSILSGLDEIANKNSSKLLFKNKEDKTSTYGFEVAHTNSSKLLEQPNEPSTSFKAGVDVTKTQGTVVQDYNNDVNGTVCAGSENKSRTNKYMLAYNSKHCSKASDDTNKNIGDLNIEDNDNNSEINNVTLESIKGTNKDNDVNNIGDDVKISGDEIDVIVENDGIKKINNNAKMSGDDVDVADDDDDINFDSDDDDDLLVSDEEDRGNNDASKTAIVKLKEKIKKDFRGDSDDDESTVKKHH